EELDNLLKENLFEYPGYVSDVKNWIVQSSVFVLPSYREGVPRSTQEAMAIGRPVITTDVPGCRETVIDGVNGFLVPKWDPQSLADRMCFFIEHPEQINIMGQESYKIALEKFDVNKVNEKLLKILTL
ncbi:glycosyltransferase, partial [Acinetobacter baumannii]|nr:glycosyltransferase [Acinetobacter baumannii]